MNHRLAAGMAVAILCAVGASAQEESAGDAKEILKKGLETSAAAGGFTFTGSVDQESPFGGVMVVGGGPSMSIGPEGKCTGTLGADGMVHVRLEKDKNSFELFKKGSKSVHKQVWKGQQIPAGTFAAEAAAAFDLAKLAKAAAKSKDAKREAGDKKVGETDCVAIKVTLTADIVEPEESPEGAAMEFKMFELKRVEATLYFGKDDNLLRQAEFKFVKGFNAAIAMAGGAGGGDDEDEDDEDGGGMGIKSSFSTTFKLTPGAYSKTSAVTVPDDVKGLLKD